MIVWYCGCTNMFDRWLCLHQIPKVLWVYLAALSLLILVVHLVPIVVGGSRVLHSLV